MDVTIKDYEKMTFEQEITSVFSNHGFTLNNKQIERFELYYKLLLLWNKQFNLTTITNQSDVIVKHFLDSVLIVNELKPNAKVIDIGTGAGFPGIPLKIMREDLDLCLVDSLNKRTLFLKEVIKTLELENVLVVHARAESLAKQSHYREFYDYVTSRAVAKLNTLLEYCSPFVSVGGVVICYKAKNVEEELLESANACQVLHVKQNKVLQFNIDENNAERNIVFFEKTKPTPTQYPREQNKAKSQPL